MYYAKELEKGTLAILGQNYNSPRFSEYLQGDPTCPIIIEYRQQLNAIPFTSIENLKAYLLEYLEDFICETENLIWSNEFYTDNYKSITFNTDFSYSYVRNKTLNVDEIISATIYPSYIRK